ncbi:MAG: bifunctional 2-polyprenyl-6-hydroxyphenol methylase/3-demethylubiquinol 3-O-methyltransferase UbiG [Acidimicrobiia bacterium]
MTDPASAVFDQDGWWDPKSFLHGLHTLLDPVRGPYVTIALENAGLDSGSQVLDLGSGGGFLAAILSDDGYDVIGIDPSMASIREAKSHVQANFAVAVGESLPFSDNSIDAVTCSEVLEHVDDVGAVVAEISRVLRPDGLLVFSMPNRTLLSRLVLIDLAQRLWPTRILPTDLHDWYRFVRPLEFSELAQRHDLVVRDIQGVGIRLRHVPSAVKALLALRTGRITYGAAGSRIQLELGRAKTIAYIGVATKTPTVASEDKARDGGLTFVETDRL